MNKDSSNVSRTDQMKELVLDLVRQGNTVSRAAKRAGISPVAVEHWRKEDPAFDADLRARGDIRAWTE
ncbi:MAG: helix-turn-helix domain-containing protein [Lentisphaerae bacterium]|nr:helix-turn-helix domain-containing protein [Lentisphaerota bacterium]MBT4817946.1 helix-turn-helix domain-containing protein [Lentisphaerota bacterium]MBT5612670.1 helix-turn-helix domain-containing protein [Lentisphaerota bacterium]MBT7053954.1 helix-turn-helix domain-containing protein [Lentisphaerota bacterium]MBT7841525.1 helix-turn-helix domain-containing protein [Lentisphaerota bacterium]